MNLLENFSKIKNLLSDYAKDYKALEQQREKLAQERDLIASLPKNLISVVEEAHSYIDDQISAWRKQFSERTLEVRCSPFNTMAGSAAINEWFKGPWHGHFAPEVNPMAVMFFFGPQLKKVLEEEILKLPEPKHSISTAERAKKLDDLDQRIAQLDGQLAGLDKISKASGLDKPLGTEYLVIDTETLVDQGFDPSEVQTILKLKKRIEML